MPFTWVPRLNYIERMWQNPCDIGWTVYIKTFALATPIIFWNLVGFQPTQLIRGFARPERQLGRRRGHRRLGRTARVLQLGDLGNEAGKRMPGARRLRGRFVSNGILHLWIVDEFVQRALWYWLLAETAVAFGVEWTSLIYQTEQCQEQNTPRSRWDNVNFVFAPLAGFQPPTGGTRVYDHIYGAEFPGSYVNVPVGTHVQAFCVVHNPSEHFDGTASMRIIDPTGPGIWSAEQTINLGMGEEGTLAADAWIPQGRSFQVQTHALGTPEIETVEGFTIWHGDRAVFL